MPKRVVRRYTEDKKSEVVSYAREFGISRASLKYGISTSTISYWFSGTPPNGPSKTLFKVPELQDFSLNGMLSVITQRKDEALELASQYERVANAIIELEQADTKLAKYIAELEQHKKAISEFTKAAPLNTGFKG